MAPKTPPRSFKTAMDVLSLSPSERSTLEVVWEHADGSVEVYTPARPPARSPASSLPRPVPAFTISPVRTVVDIQPDDGDLVTLPRGVLTTITRTLEPHSRPASPSKQSPKQALKNRIISPSDSNERTCRKCQAVFGSRNALFEHVFSNTCGSPPSPPKKKRHRKRKRSSSASRSPSNCSPASQPSASPPPKRVRFDDENVKSATIPPGSSDNEDVVAFVPCERPAYLATRPSSSPPPSSPNKAARPPLTAASTPSKAATASQLPKFTVADLAIPAFKPKFPASSKATLECPPASTSATPAESPPGSRASRSQTPPAPASQAASRSQPPSVPPALSSATPECPPENNGNLVSQAATSVKPSALPALRPASQAP